MNESNKKPIDPKELAKRVVIPPTKAPTRTIEINPEILKRGFIGKVDEITTDLPPKGLATMPQPTDNPPPKAEQTQTIIKPTKDNPAPPGTIVAKLEPPQEVKKSPENSNQDIKEMEKMDEKDEKGRFKEGWKGGPGRPRKENSLSQKIAERLDQGHAKRPDGTVVTKMETIANVAVEKAVEGDIKFVRYVHEYMEGKPMQKIQVIAPEDAEGTVLSEEAEAALLQTFGRK